MARWLWSSSRNFIRWIFRRKTGALFVLRLNGEGTAATNSIALREGYKFQEATPDDLPACAAVAGIGLEECNRRITEGNRCFVTFYDNEPVNLNWLHVGCYYVRGLGYSNEEENGAGYLYNLYTHPDHRGKGLYKAALINMVNILSRQGITCFHQIVVSDNKIPFAVLPTLGYGNARNISHTRICGLKFTVARDPSGKVLSRSIFVYPPKNLFQT